MAMGADDEVISSCFVDALRHFQTAKKYGKARDSDWHTSLVSSGMECWLDVQTRMKDLEPEKRMHELKGLAGYIMDDVIMGNTYLELARYYFSRSTLQLADRQYQQSMQILIDCCFYVKEARRLVPDDPDHARECGILEKDILAQKCVAESGLVRVNGEELLQKMMQTVLHWFQKSTTSSSTHDKRAAMSHNALGFLYGTVLKIANSVKTCLGRVLEQADSVMPRALRKFDWFAFVRASAEKYQRERLAEEKEMKRKRQAEARILLQGDLSTLKQKFNECTKLQFLKFVYATYPPTNPHHKLGDVSDTPETDELKKLYRMAAIHYHPDKVKEEEQGEKWKILTEEITKLITKHYDYLKGLG